MTLWRIKMSTQKREKNENLTKKEKRKIIPSAKSVSAKKRGERGKEKKKYYTANEFCNWNETALYC
jgi:hypothetical protein